jgi:hypothetical protein
LADGRLTFSSPVRTDYPENNTVHALWFPADKGPKRALVVAAAVELGRGEDMSGLQAAQ